jgi:hypothetical protein
MIGIQEQEPRSDSFDLAAILRSVRWAIGSRRLALWTVLGLAAGLGASAAVVALQRAAPPHSAHLIPALLLPLLGAASFALLSLLAWPSRAEAARVLDSRFGLRDRVTTALEFSVRNDVVARAQRRETAAAVVALPLRSCHAGRPGRREAAICLLCGLALASALAIPGWWRAQAAVPAVGSTFSARERQAALARLAVISRAFEQGLPPAQRESAPARRADRLLERLRSQIEHAPSQLAALRAVSQTQAQLQQVQQSLHPVSAQAPAALSRAMQSSMTAQEKRQSQQGPAGEQSAAESMLQRLASTVPHMAPSKTSQLTHNLQRASNHLSDASLRQALRNAASALAHNDRKSAATELGRASNQLRKSPAQRRTAAGVQHTRKRLDSVKSAAAGLRRRLVSIQHNSLTNQDDRNTNARRNLTGQQQQSGVGKNTGGRQAGSSPKPGSRVSDSGKNTNVGGNNQGRRGPHNSNTRHFATVYVPGLLHRGQSRGRSRSLTNPGRVPVVSYRAVIARYSHTARAALDRMALPPDVRGYVQRYFERLSH